MGAGQLDMAEKTLYHPRISVYRDMAGMGLGTPVQWPKTGAHGASRAKNGCTWIQQRQSVFLAISDWPTPIFTRVWPKTTECSPIFATLLSYHPFVAILYSFRGDTNRSVRTARTDLGPSENSGSSTKSMNNVVSQIYASVCNSNFTGIVASLFF